jgi:SAM-dependent methyltransferase
MSGSTRIEREMAHWSRWKDRADAVWGWRTPAGKIRAERRAGLFRELAHIDEHSIVLEIGCGTGEFTHRVAPHVGRMWATDLAPELLEQAEERVRSSGPGARVTFELQDAMRLTFPDGGFDAVFGCSVLHHVDAAAALSEVARVLKPGGWCVFSEPNMLNPQVALQKNVGFLKRRSGDSPDESAFFRPQVLRLLERAGFDSILVRNFDFLHPATPPGWVGAVERLGLFCERLPLLREISGSLIFRARKPVG